MVQWYYKEYRTKEGISHVECQLLKATGENFGLLYNFEFEISTLSLHTLIGLPLDIIFKSVNILSKPAKPKVSSVAQSN